MNGDVFFTVGYAVGYSAVFTTIVVIGMLIAGALL